MRIRISRDVAAAILAHAREESPREACGVLAGTLGEPRAVVRAFRIRNVHADPRRGFLLAPEDLLRALVETEERLGLEVVGFYHSHPAGPPRPSGEDARLATWPDASHVVVWLAPEEGLGCWRWDAARGRFEAEAVD